VTESFRCAAAEDPGYGQLFAVLMRRRFWLLGVLCSVLSVATILTLIAKPTYKALCSFIEPNYQEKEKEDQNQN